MFHLAGSSRDLSDFVRVDFVNERPLSDDTGAGQAMHKKDIQHSSAKTESTETVIVEALQELHPGSSLVFTKDFQIDILRFPHCTSHPWPDIQRLTQVTFRPLARRLSQLPGILENQVKFSAFRVVWKEYEFVLYIISWNEGGLSVPQTLRVLVRDHPDEQPARQLFLEAEVWCQKLHDEIWVFNDGFWAKDHKLWIEVQKADWKDIILKGEFKKSLQQDVEGFFGSEKIYKDLAVAWKRGLIMYGPPGNGKTISLKAIMKFSGYPSLYVRSFQSPQGEEFSMRLVFEKARECSPCVLVLEDLDVLITDRNRSFFLNQLDGLDDNDGLLVVGTTNHFERLDAGLSTRPSRFDRKYLFDDPDEEQRLQYARYWQVKLKDNSIIVFSGELLQEIAVLTDGFSFAYLKEAFVASLILLAGGKEKGTFEDVLKAQIKLLREQFGKVESELRAKSRLSALPGLPFTKLFP